MTAEPIAARRHLRGRVTRSGLTLLRLAGAGWVCTIAMIVPGIDRRATLAATMSLYAAVHLVRYRHRTRDTLVIGVVNDVAAGLATAALATELWQASAVWVGSTVAIAAISMPLRSATAIGAGAAAGIVAVGVIGDVPDLVVTSVGMIPVWCASIACGHLVRTGVARSERELIDTVTGAGAVVAYIDLTALTVTRLIGDVHALTGYTAEQWCSVDQRVNVHPDDLHQYSTDEVFTQEEGLTERVVRYWRGDDRWAWLREVTSVHVDEYGNRLMCGFTVDVSEFAQNRELLIQQARTDVVTGLPNRVALAEELERRIGDHDAFALVVIDLNDFKAINDTLGHEAGDIVLRTVGRRIGERLRPSDHLARLGGDEFAIVIGGDVGTDRLSADLCAIATACSAPLDVRGVRLATSMAAGVVAWTDGADQASLLRQADIAMYAAKHANQQYRFFDSSLERTSTMELTLTAALPGALDAGEIRTHFQPQYDLVTGELVGAEALLRWHHPELGVLPPDTFLELAQLSAHATAVTDRTVAQTVAVIAAAQALGHPIPIAVNVSSRSLFEIGFAETIRSHIERCGVDPTLLTIEITESDPLPTSPEIVCRLTALSALGVRLSVDDFGTGHSSLARLRALAVDELKIDRSFVRGMLACGHDRLIVESIIELAALHGCRIVAEGVDLDAHADLLRELGCRIGQGLLFAEPQPADAFVDLLSRHAPSREVARWW